MAKVKQDNLKEQKEVVFEAKKRSRTHLNIKFKNSVKVIPMTEAMNSEQEQNKINSTKRKKMINFQKISLDDKPPSENKNLKDISLGYDCLRTQETEPNENDTVQSEMIHSVQSMKCITKPRKKITLLRLQQEKKKQEQDENTKKMKKKCCCILI